MFLTYANFCRSSLLQIWAEPTAAAHGAAAAAGGAFAAVGVALAVAAVAAVAAGAVAADAAAGCGPENEIYQ